MKNISGLKRIDTSEKPVPFTSSSIAPSKSNWMTKVERARKVIKESGVTAQELERKAKLYDAKKKKKEINHSSLKKSDAKILDKILYDILLIAEEQENRISELKRLLNEKEVQIKKLKKSVNK